MIAVKEGNIEAIKAEMALHIACFFGNMCLFFQNCPMRKKVPGFRWNIYEKVFVD
jgi:hypothetical protein